MLKALDSPYGTGRQRGAWWKWKIDPYTFDGVMLIAQPGHGRRSNLYTDYTFGVWSNAELVPVAKAYSGLSNDEIAELDRWIRAHTIEKFGPMRRWSRPRCSSWLRRHRRLEPAQVGHCVAVSAHCAPAR